MPRSISAFTTRPLDVPAMDALMSHLGGGRDGQGGWILQRNGREVRAVLATDTTADLFSPEELQAIADELGGNPRGRVALIFDDSAEDRMEFRMAKAVALALAESAPVVVDDHAGRQERVIPAGKRPK